MVIRVGFPHHFIDTGAKNNFFLLIFWVFSGKNYAERKLNQNYLAYKRLGVIPHFDCQLHKNVSELSYQVLVHVTKMKL